MRVVAYVSGHGFGHATRTGEVLRVLREDAPDARVTVVGSAPASLFRGAIGGDIDVRQEECDVGLVQRGPLEIDEPASLARWLAFARDWDQRVERERRWLLEVGASVVLGDVPPLAFEAAARAGVPGIALANFSWDWIYRHLARREPGMIEAADWAAASYRNATLLLRLPFAGDLSAFRRVEDVPPVARRPRLMRHEARQRLGLGDECVVLWSFGGHSLPGFDVGRLARWSQLSFIVTTGVGATPPNVRRVTDVELLRTGLSYVDLVGACDVLVTKPGYGIVTDALAARTRVVYTERGDFPEYPILVAGMTDYVPCVYASNEEILAGDVAAAVERVLGIAWPPAPRLDGADLAASRIVEIAAEGRS